MVETITNSSERRESFETWVRPCQAFVCHTQKICTQDLVARGLPAPEGAHYYSIHSSLLPLTTVTTIIIIKEIFCIQTREATRGGKRDALSGIGKIGLILFIFLCSYRALKQMLKREWHIAHQDVKSSWTLIERQCMTEHIRQESR